MAVLSGFLGLVVTVLWLMIGWRAMRAHERLAESAHLAVHALRKTGGSRSSRDDNKIRELYSVFIEEVQEAKDIPFPERQEMFKTWMAERERGNA